MSFRIIAANQTEQFTALGVPGPTLLEMLQAASVPIKSSCSGKGICRQCRVQVKNGVAPITASDRRAFKSDALEQGWRLSCGLRPKTAIEVSFPQSYLFQNDVEWFRAPISDYAWACDFGTTGVELSGVDQNGEFARVKSLNRQVVRGADIMTRLEYAQNHGVEPLRAIAEEQVGKLIALLRAEKTNRGSPEFMERPEILFAGNSAVTSFLANLPIEHLAVSPYQPASLASQEFAFAGLRATSLPLLNSFVGGDLFAGLFHLWSARDDFEEPWILMDVGTNSEILLYDGEKLFVASTPAGPAFEGSNISIGMRAEIGAITDPTFRDGKWSYRVIGGDIAKGICGSALVSAVDETVEAGLVSADGEILAPARLPFTTSLGLNQDDFREFQLAKSAIRTGLDLVGQTARGPAKRLFLAGAFGEHLPLAAARRLGMLPTVETIALGNTSRLGTIAWIRAPQAERAEFTAWLERVKFPVELALSDDFQARFVENLGLRPEVSA